MHTIYVHWEQGAGRRGREPSVVVDLIGPHLTAMVSESCKRPTVIARTILPGFLPDTELGLFDQINLKTNIILEVFGVELNWDHGQKVS